MADIFKEIGTVPAEAVELLRDKKEKHYRMPDGSMKAIIAPRAIHFKSDGQWKELREFGINTVKIQGKNVYVSNSDDFKVKLNGTSVVVTKNGNDYTYAIDGLYVDDTRIATPNYSQFSRNGNEFTFTEIFPSCDLKIYVEPTRWRDELIIKENILEGTQYDGEHIYIRYTAPEAGDVKVTNQSASIKYSGTQRRDIPLYYDHTGTTLKKGIAVDDLYSPYDRYPIIIDPTDDFDENDSRGVFSRDSGGDGIDSYSSTNDPANYYVGVVDSDGGAAKVTYDIYRIYVKFDLSSLSGATINSAYWHGYTGGAYGGTGSTTGYLNQVTSEQNLASASDQNVYNAVMGTNISSYTADNNPTFNWDSIACTSYVNTHKGGSCDFGIRGYETGADNVDSRHTDYVTNATYEMHLEIDYTAAAAGTNMQINIGDTWKDIDAMKINIGDTWKAVASAQINIGDTWKDIF